MDTCWVGGFVDWFAHWTRSWRIYSHVCIGARSAVEMIASRHPASNTCCNQSEVPLLYFRAFSLDTARARDDVDDRAAGGGARRLRRPHLRRRRGQMLSSPTTSFRLCLACTPLHTKVLLLIQLTPTLSPLSFQPNCGRNQPTSLT
jgi:hypothetical protein